MPADPLSALREIVGGMTPGEWEAICDKRRANRWRIEGDDMWIADLPQARRGESFPEIEANAAGIVAANRLLRALAEPGMVETVAGEILGGSTFSHEDRQDMASAILATLARAALGGEDHA